ncbi:zinc ribbon domain-containing protein [Sphingomonas arenae]|uniref:zinc ribbon domain-containing protein n=1 Tax=Sphingomonas arenae TaxID=2812555 RepID=UPI00196829E8|nr:zinc ribbon domain-containing protein [Sphingomonas arenae]
MFFGKSGQYQYYACSDRARAGLSVCKGRRIGRSKLDNIVLDALEPKLLTPERLRDLLSGWLDHASDVIDARRQIQSVRPVVLTQARRTCGADRPGENGCGAA